MTFLLNLPFGWEAMSRATKRCCTTMIGGLAALILLSTESLIQTAEVPHLISLTVAEHGDNVNLTCTVPPTEHRYFHMYKQPLGHMLQTVVSGFLDKMTVTDQFKDSRFNVTKEDDRILLTIRNVSKDDEATYFCQESSKYSQSFVNGTFLAVNDHKNQQKHVYVKQSPETTSVQPGDSATLQCSLLSKNKHSSVQCPGEHSVHWFRAGSEGWHPGIIYSHSHRSDERSCVYSLSKTIKNSSDAATYYCAVVTCGEILLGEGTTVETGSELEPVVLVLGVLLACCVIVVLALIVFVNRRVCEHCKGASRASQHSGHDSSTLDPSNNLDGEAEEVNYVALNIAARKTKRAMKTRESPHECFYSTVVQQRPHFIAGHVHQATKSLISIINYFVLTRLVVCYSIYFCAVRP
uniref:Ig-like domain-containing protein n=1 Tax=Scophthalmus maximus TaxID=52904 RepID=A0A8D3AFV7_SCOMX